jgi:integrase
MDMVQLNPCTCIPRPGKEKQRDRVLSEEELRRVWQALDKENPIRAATFQLRLLTAQRGGEVRVMRFKDIDGDWWTIPAEFSKNGLSHRVPLSPQAQRVIEQVQRFAEQQDALRKRSEWVFPHPKRPEDPIYESGLFARRIRKNSGVDFRAHDFRRTAASMMAGMGTPRLVIGKILNHVEPGVTKVYDRHSYDREKQEALNAWGARLSGIVSSPEPDKADSQPPT